MRILPSLIKSFHTLTSMQLTVDASPFTWKAELNCGNPEVLFVSSECKVATSEACALRDSGVRRHPPYAGLPLAYLTIYFNTKAETNKNIRRFQRYQDQGQRGVRPTGRLRYAFLMRRSNARTEG